MTYETFSCDVDESGIAHVKIDLPGQSMNVWNAALMRDYAAFVGRLNGDPRLKGAVISSGKASGFIAGADLRLMGGRKSDSMQDAFESSFALSHDLRLMETGGHTAKDLSRGAVTAKPVACVVSGLALGGGLELVLACHYRVAVDDPRVQLGLPEITIGLLPGGGGTQRLLRLAGVEPALQMVLRGKPVDAHTAHGMGFIDRVASPDEAADIALEWVKGNPRAAQPWDRADFRIPGITGPLDPELTRIFTNANAAAQAETKHNYAAAPAIISCFYEGALVPFDTALKIESKYFTKLLMSDQSRNMIRSLFVNKLAAEKGAQRPAGVRGRELRKIAVVGGGLMGAGIAHVIAKAKIPVVVLDVSEEAASRAVEYSRRIVDKAVAKGTLEREQADALLARISSSSSYEDIADADLVIEAVFEQADVKADVLKRISKAVAADAIIATNTSTLPISELAAHVENPGRFVGMHFFSPVERMPLLEIIRGDATDPVALATAFDFNSHIRKTPILVKDARGFFTNRVVPPYMNEAVLMVLEGVDPIVIDNVALALGMPIGPLALTDETSLTLGHDIQRATKAALGQAYEPAGTEQFFARMATELGRQGRRSGGGIYDYLETGEKRPWSELAVHFPPTGERIPPAEIRQRLLYIQLVATARALDEQVVLDPASADLGALFGWGFPSWTGGPMSHVDAIGLEAFVAEADRLASQYGDRFDVPPSFRQKAASGQKLYA